jgi:thymidylate synthase
VYNNHLDQAQLQLTRDPLPLPALIFKRRPHSLFDYRYEDIVFAGYESHPPIRAEVAV